MTPKDEIRLEQTAGGLISRILIERSAKKNALSPAMLERLIDCVDVASHDNSRIIMVQSAVPGVFSAGADINYLGTEDDDRGEELLQELSQCLQKAPKVTVAISDGLTIGAGLAVFLSCDLRLATNRSTFRMPPVRLGRVYSLEGTAHFVRTMGLTAASEMLLAARQFDIHEALRCGLATRMVADQLDALNYCEAVVACSPLAQRATKAALYFLGQGATADKIGSDALDSIGRLTNIAQDSEDSKEALRAFREKRPPVFTGR